MQPGKPERLIDPRVVRSGECNPGYSGGSGALGGWKFDRARPGSYFQFVLLTRIFSRIGAGSRSFFESFGNMTLLFFGSVAALRKSPVYFREIGAQYAYIGRQSFPLILVTSTFVGLVLGIQIGTQIHPGTPPWIEGGLIYQSIVLEMGPIVTGLVMAGRVGSGIAAEIGTMTVTEQVDALRTMGIDPIEMLVMPRLVAALFALPILTATFDIIGCLTGFISSYYTINLRFSGFLRGIRSVFDPTQIYTSLIKGFFNGLIVSTVGSFFGLTSGQGAKGVGNATTRAVIWACVIVIVVDYVSSAALQHIW